MNQIIPSYIGGVLTYSNVHSNRDRSTTDRNELIMSTIGFYVESGNFYRTADIEPYIQNEIISNIINYALQIDRREDLSGLTIYDSALGDLILIAHSSRSTVEGVLGDGRAFFHWFEVAFSRDYKNIYYWLHYRLRDVEAEVPLQEKSIDEIMEEVIEILEYLRITDYFEFEAGSIWRSDLNTYVVRDVTGNIEVHYDLRLMRITGIIIGFNL